MVTAETRTPPERTERRGLIATVNEVYDLMEGVVTDLQKQTNRTPDQEKQIIDFDILQKGRNLLTGGGPLTDDLPKDSLTNKFTDSKTGQTFTIEEKLPAEIVKKVLADEIHDLKVHVKASQNNPSIRAHYEALLTHRTNQLDQVARNTTRYQPASPEEREAWIEREAFWISQDPKRRTFSDLNDWYTAVSVLDNREFINIPANPAVSPAWPSPTPVSILPYQNVPGPAVNLPTGSDIKAATEAIRGQPSTGSPGPEAPIRTTAEQRAIRLRGLSRVMWAPLVLAIATALLQVSDRGPRATINPAPNVGVIGAAPSDKEGNLQYKVIWPEQNQAPNLIKHLYQNQPDQSGIYGSLYGHEVYELAKVLDPTILEDQIKTGQPISPDDPRIGKAVDDFQKANPQQFDEVIANYTKTVVENNPPGTLLGEDGIANPEFNSPKMADVYNQVMVDTG